MAERTIGVGVIGMGFMGSTHAAAYRDAARDGYGCRIVAVADGNRDRTTGAPWRWGNLPQTTEEQALFDPRDVRAYTDPGALLADAAVELVSICTPTDTHVDLALAALRAGKHVLLEKPVALKAVDVQRLAEESVRAERLCAPAMCMRYWPGWAWLKERIDSGEFGAVRSAFFQRLGSRPGWGGGFYDDPRRCGGALFDLHIHDADFVWWCFGMPGAVSTRGTLDHACTFYRYENLPGSRQNPGLVVAEGGWMGQPGWKFRMRYLVAFDEALADFDIGREPALLVCRGESSHAVELPPGAGYRYQARAVVSALTGAGGCAVPMEDAVRVTGLVEAERRSLESGREVEIKPQSAS